MSEQIENTYILYHLWPDILDFLNDWNVHNVRKMCGPVSLSPAEALFCCVMS